ncbi:hypothetical protein [Humisphaera borealis]|uniref:Uncharacterized protein n=1 Tax=Humisphaera borealis TaxID=2807512 RepID=A0A7M2WR16_9BACT|nr:hypothetical protein [Humisphaera borealis]QOV87916.1 hypothetical protein IPV69_16780 [Humisphaera borealis]
MVAIQYPPGLDNDTFPALKAIVSTARSDYSEYVPPSCWILFFKPKKLARAEAVVVAVRELRQRDERFRVIGVALHAGVVIYESDYLGRIRSTPLGDEVNVVLRAARSDAQLA